MRSPGNALRYSLWLLFAVSLAVACFPPIWNIDLFWHIAAGDWIRLHRTIPNTDIFSAVAPDRAWIPFQWLFEVGVSFLEDAGAFIRAYCRMAAADDERDGRCCLLAKTPPQPLGATPPDRFALYPFW